MKDYSFADWCLFFIFVVTIVIIIGLLWTILAPELFNAVNIKEVKSSFDSNKHNVQGDLPCPTCASDTMAKIHHNTTKLIEHLKKNYPNDPRTIRLKSRYNPEAVYEGRPSPGGLGDTSYTINKGQKLVYCIRSGRDKSKIHDIDHLGLVYLHELSHLAAQGFGHGEEFQDTLKWILERAVEINIYDPINYREKPREYCGIIISSNPYFDD